MNPGQVDDLTSPFPGPAQRLSSGAVAVTIGSGLFVVSGYVIHVALGRALGPVDYGLFGVVIGFITVVNSLQTAGVPQAVARFTAERAAAEEDLLTTGAVLQFATGVALGAVLFALAGPLASVMGDDRLGLPLMLASLALPPYALFALLLGFSGGRGRYSRQGWMLSVYSIARTFLTVGLGLIAALPGAILGYVLAPLVGAASGQLRMLWRGRLLPLRQILTFSAPLLLLALFSIGHLNVDLFVVKSVVEDPAAAGYYTAAQNIARVPYFLTTGLAIILLPAVARAAAGSPAQAQALVGQAMRLGFLLIAPLAALLVGSADDVLNLLYTEAYQPATLALALLSPAIGCFAMSALLASLLAGVGRAFEAVVAAGTGLLGSIVLCLLLVPSFGIAGAAAATLVSAGAALLVAMIASRRVFAVSVPWLTVVRAGTVAVVIGLAARLTDGALGVIVGLPLLLLAYVVLLAIIGELRREDLSRVRELLPARVS